MTAFDEEYGILCDRLVEALDCDHSDAEGVLDAYLMYHDDTDMEVIFNAIMKK